jgi:hypothetical protein
MIMHTIKIYKFLRFFFEDVRILRRVGFLIPNSSDTNISSDRATATVSPFRLIATAPRRSVSLDNCPGRRLISVTVMVGAGFPFRSLIVLVIGTYLYDNQHSVDVLARV